MYEYIRREKKSIETSSGTVSTALPLPYFAIEYGMNAGLLSSLALALVVDATGCAGSTLFGGGSIPSNAELPAGLGTGATTAAGASSTDLTTFDCFDRPNERTTGPPLRLRCTLGSPIPMATEAAPPAADLGAGSERDAAEGISFKDGAEASGVERFLGAGSDVENRDGPPFRTGGVHAGSSATLGGGDIGLTTGASVSESESEP